MKLPTAEEVQRAVDIACELIEGDAPRTRATLRAVAEAWRNAIPAHLPGDRRGLLLEQPDA